MELLWTVGELIHIVSLAQLTHLLPAAFTITFLIINLILKKVLSPLSSWKCARSTLSFWFCSEVKKKKKKRSERVSPSVMSDSSDPMNCTPPASFVYGIFQARILKWIAMPFSRGSSWPRDWTWVSCIAGRFFTVWSTRNFCSNYMLYYLDHKVQ